MQKRTKLPLHQATNCFILEKAQDNFVTLLRRSLGKNNDKNYLINYSSKIEIIFYTDKIHTVYRKFYLITKHIYIYIYNIIIIPILALI